MKLEWLAGGGAMTEVIGAIDGSQTTQYRVMAVCSRT